MSDYSQPHFYRFNQDSISLVNWASSLVPSGISVLDLCAGSGVIGIEVANAINAKEVHFIELQEGFKNHLTHNACHLLRKEIFFEIHISTLKKWRPQRRYDLVLCNPPYYLPGHGEASPDAQKDLARRFVIDGWAVLLEKIDATLSDSGVAVLVVPKNLILKNTIISAAEEFLISLIFHEQDHLAILEIRRKL